MATSPFEWKIFEWDNKPSQTNQILVQIASNLTFSKQRVLKFGEPRSGINGFVVNSLLFTTVSMKIDIEYQGFCQVTFNKWFRHDA